MNSNPTESIMINESFNMMTAKASAAESMKDDETKQEIANLNSKYESLFAEFTS
jgi:hypothetical protein